MTKTEKPPLALWAFAMALASAIVAFSTYRRFFGLDVTDEAYYVGLVRRFAMGDRLFSDEVTVVQGIAFLLSPLVRLHHLVVGSDNGVMVFMRFAHLGFTLLLAFALYTCVKQWLSRPAAVLAGALVPLFIPFNIPNLSYNTVGGGLICLGLILLGIAKQEEGRPARARVWFAAAGASLATAAAAYPPLAILTLLGMAGGVWLAGSFRKSAPFLIAGAALPTIIIAGGLALADWQNVQDIIRFAQSYNSGEPAHLRLWRAVTVIAENLPYGWYFVAGMAALLAALLLRAPWAAAVVACGLFWAAGKSPRFGDGVYGSLGYVTYGGLLLPVLLGARDLALDLRRLLVLLGVVGFAGGFVTTWSSNNGFLNFAIGFQPAFIAATLAVLAAFERGFAGKRSAAFAQAAFVSVVSVAMLLMLWRGVYRDEALRDLTYRVNEGPYAGIYSNEHKATFYAAMRKDIETWSRGGGVFFYDAFPGGYLLAPAGAAANTLWVLRYNEFPRDMIVRYWERTRLPAMVLQVKRFPHSADKYSELVYSQREPLTKYLTQKGYREVVNNENYVIRIPGDGRPGQLP